MKKRTNLNKKVSLLSGAFLTGIIAGLSVEEIQAADLLEFASLGTGAEVRSELIDMNLDQNIIPSGTLELTLNEGKCGEDDKKAEGEKKDAKKSDAKKGDVKSEDAKGKTAESKCGEGKCGENDKSAAVKDGEKKENKEAKTSESKCGEGKCG